MCNVQRKNSRESFYVIKYEMNEMYERIGSIKRRDVNDGQDRIRDGLKTSSVIKQQEKIRISWIAFLAACLIGFSYCSLGDWYISYRLYNSYYFSTHKVYMT